MADNIHQEIHSQDKVMDQIMTNDLVEASRRAARAGAVMGKLSDFLQTKDRFQLCTIVGLFLVAVVLFLFYYCLLVVYS